MPFDKEFADQPEFAVRRFSQAEPEPASADDAEPARCGCPFCSGAVIDSGDLDPDRPLSFLNADERGGVGPNGKPSKTVAEAAYHLNRTYASWNDFYIQPGVADVDNHWDDAYWGGAPSIVTYAFRSTAPATMPSETSGFSRFTEQQIQVTLLALQAWADVANIVFVRVGEGTSGEAAYSDSATILFSNYSTADDGAAAFAYYPSQSASGGDVWVKSSESYNANPVAGGYGPLVLIHEIGHAIGFSHPGAYNAGPGVSITYEANAEYYEDSRQYTVMSYFGSFNTGASLSAYAATILLDDIAAAQRTYGVNTTTRTGDTVYGFNSTADRPWFLATSSASILIFAIWDAGGVDTLDFSGYSQAQVITLISGNFSNVGGQVGNVSIAIGATIENAIGGSGADTMIGNSVGNRLTGNAGADTLTGNGGADIFVATVGGGADTITDFSVGSDKIDVAAFGGYVSAVQNGLNTLVTVATGVTFTLLNVTATALTAANFVGAGTPPPGPPPDGYNLINGTGAGETLNGTGASDQIYGLGGADTLNGGESADWLDGGADNDTLNGGAGADHMIGGTGDDVFIVDNAGDTTVEGASAGTDRVETALASWTLGADIENLTGTSGAGQTLTGNGLNNVILGAGGADTLNGGDGDDTLNGGTGADAMTGGAGNDSYVVDNAGDSVTEGASAGTDTVTTSLASYTLGANLENLTGSLATGQTLTGNTLGNTIQGGAGADTLDGGTGADTLIGGGGDDSYVVDNVGDVVTEGASAGTDTVTTSLASYTLGANVENLTGSLGTGQTLTGNTLGNTIQGGAGADTLDGGTGADTLIGGGGNDSYVVDNAGDVVTEGASAGTDTVTTSLASYTLGANVENLTGSLATGQTLTANAVANAVTGGAGADTINGGGGDDSLRGNGGADVFVATAGGGADTVLDFVVGTDRIDVSAFGGYQSIVQQGSHTLVTVAAGVSFLLQNVTASTVTNASFIGISGPTVINGNTSANVLNGTAGADQINGFEGNDTLNGLGGDDTLDGGVGADKLNGGDGADTLLGGDSADTLDGGAGADAMTGGLGADTYVVDDAGDTVVEGADVGKDTVRTSLATYVLPTNVEFMVGLLATGQTLTGNAHDNTITGGAGADLLAGLAGADTINGGEGGDTLDGGGDADKLSGEGGDDSLIGGDANDTLLGGDGADRLRGDAGSDKLTGGAGADVFVVTAGGGSDTVYDFVVGTDLIDLTATGAYQSITQSGADTVIAFATGVSMRLIGITASTVTDAIFVGLPTGGGPNIINGTNLAETIIGTVLVDHIAGLGGADTIRGGGGADLIDGGADNDKLYGEAGADTITGGSGSDQMSGGDGADLFIFAPGSGADSITDFVVGTDLIDLTGYGVYTSIVQSGPDTLITIVKGATIKLTGVTASAMTNASFIGLQGPGDLFEIDGTEVKETLLGTAFNDHIRALGGNDTVRAGAGNDQVEGGEGHDTLYGDDGADTLTGNAGNDSLLGGLGSDTLTGGVGNDTQTGGAGADIFVVTADLGADVILDFELGVDRIDLSAYGDYLSIVASGADSLITFATGVTVRVTGIAPGLMTDAQFIGFSAPAPEASAGLPALEDEPSGGGAFAPVAQTREGGHAGDWFL